MIKVKINQSLAGKINVLESKLTQVLNQQAPKCKKATIFMYVSLMFVCFFVSLGGFEILQPANSEKHIYHDMFLQITSITFVSFSSSSSHS